MRTDASLKIDAFISGFRNGIPIAGARWQVLGRNRALFIPRAGWGVQSGCLNFFLWRPWQRLAGRLALVFGHHASLAWGRDVSVTQLREQVGNLLFDRTQLAGSDENIVAIRMGSPGPYQKTSVLLVSNSGKALCYFKLAAIQSADMMVAQESAWLERLNRIAGLRTHIPCLLGSGQMLDGRAYLATSIAPSQASATTFGNCHAAFLRALGKGTSSLGRFSQSAEARFIDIALAELDGTLGEHAGELRCAWREAQSHMEHWQGPLVVVHRDFAPWNIRCDASDLFVFDWEYARDQGSPLHDFFHFHFIQRALTRWRRPDAKFAVRLVREASTYATADYLAGYFRPEHVAGVLLAYLLDVVLFYCQAEGCLDTRHPVIAGYLDLIRLRKQWL